MASWKKVYAAAAKRKAKKAAVRARRASQKARVEPRTKSEAGETMVDEKPRILAASEIEEELLSRAAEAAHAA